jgi:Transglutaminase-like superfamily
MRRFVPYALLPLALLACALAAVPWLRAFPADVLAAPLFGASLLGVLLPVIVFGIGVRPLWLSALLDLVLLVFYELLVCLRNLDGFGELWSGLVHGPAQILSFALPLESPRTLLVAPVALAWVTGSIVGECLARGWHTVLPYVAVMVAAGLSYAATARAVTSASDGRHYDTIFAAALLIVLLLTRTAQAWVVQDVGAEGTQPEGALPLRTLGVGAVVALTVAAAAAGAVQTAAFGGQAVTPARVPPLDQSRPVTPVAFVAGLRPADPGAAGQPLFQLTTDRATSNYVALASVDYYDGDSWTFTRTFRPSGGAVPTDPDPAMRSAGVPVRQLYEITGGPLTTVPWMPHLDRVQDISGVAVDIDADSGMIVPARPLRAGDAYTVTSAVPSRTFDELGKTALLGTSAAQLDTTLPNGLAGPLTSLVHALSQETCVPSDSPVPFLQAVARELRGSTTLAGRPEQSGATPSAPPSSPSASSSPTPPAGSSAPASAPHAGGTAFADVLASIRGARVGTPEQFATFVALVARALGVPAEVVAGFRLPPASHGGPLAPGSYTVTSGEAWTWVEIPVRGLGWVVLDPSPPRYSGQAPGPTEGVTHSPSPTPAPSKNALLTRSNNGGNAAAPPSRPARSSGHPVTVVVIIVALIVVVLAVALLVLPVVGKQLRSRRRQRGDPRHQVVGAWQESLDLLMEAGLPDLTHATTAEVGAAASARFGAGPADRARAIGRAADVAIFSPATPVASADADAAWRSQAELRQAVHAALRRRDRVRARLRYHRQPASWHGKCRRRGA